MKKRSLKSGLLLLAITLGLAAFASLAIADTAAAVNDESTFRGNGVGTLPCSDYCVGEDGAKFCPDACYPGKGNNGVGTLPCKAPTSTVKGIGVHVLPCCCGDPTVGTLP